MWVTAIINIGPKPLFVLLVSIKISRHLIYMNKARREFETKLYYDHR